MPSAAEAGAADLSETADSPRELRRRSKGIRSNSRNDDPEYTCIAMVNWLKPAAYIHAFKAWELATNV
jgi:hypothetical protein